MEFDSPLSFSALVTHKTLASARVLCYTLGMAEGIDVSKWQGTVNWASVKAAGKVFAVARSSIGMSTADPTFVANYKGMVANDLIPGAYHLVAATSTGAQQAANWKKQLDAAGFDKGLLVLDVEGWAETNSNPPEDTLAAVEYLCDWIRNTYNRTPIIYTGVFWRDYLKQAPNNFGSKLWLAAYVNDPTPYVPKAWDTWKIWQYTSSGSVSGITGNVDLDKSAGTLYSLQRLAGWEWDELATKEEIQQVVAAEVNKAVAALQASDAAVATDIKAVYNANTAEVKAAVAGVLSAVSAQITPLSAAGTMDMFNNVINEIKTLDTGELESLIETLHAHLCKRVDLHLTLDTNPTV